MNNNTAQDTSQNNQAQDGPSTILPAVQQSVSDQAASAPQSPPPVSANPQSDQPVPVNQTMPVESSLVPVPDLAADSDLIEKEWVNKAKHIVGQTAEDPFMQQQELSKMKADYMKKRYNKELGAS